MGSNRNNQLCGKSRFDPNFPFAAAAAGIVAWFNDDNLAWLIGAVLMAGMFPFTAIFIVSTNLKLLRVDAAAAPREAEQLHARWSVMHNWRTVLGLPAFPLFLWALAV